MEVRLRSRVSEAELEQKVGKILTDRDINMIVTRDMRVLKPNGELLFIYRKAAVPEDLLNIAYPILTKIRKPTENRGLASGSIRFKRFKSQRQTRSATVMSSIIGAMEPLGGRHPYCRLTAWTGQNTEQFAQMYKFFQFVADQFRINVPDRFYAQEERAKLTKPDWVIPGTPFTTITVNNTYATGVHKDQGDLPEGFSCLATLRKGEFSGGTLCFPEFRVGVNMGHGDVILMDAHEWHGNIDLVKESEDAERISCVFYYRTDMVKCETAARELEKGKAAMPGQFVIDPTREDRESVTTRQRRSKVSA